MIGYCKNCGKSSVTHGRACAERNPRRFDLTAFAQEATRRMRVPPSDRQRVEQMRADPARQFDGEVAVRKLPRGVLP